LYNIKTSWTNLNKFTRELKGKYVKRYLYQEFYIQNSLKRGDFVTITPKHLSNYVMKKIQENQEGPQDISFSFMPIMIIYLGKMNKNTVILFDITQEVSLKTDPHTEKKMSNQTP
jgi:hypothetical protein